MNFLKNALRNTILLSTLPAIFCEAQNTSCETSYNYQYAIVRDLSESFENGLKLQQPKTPIDTTLAKQQHEQYILLLERHIPQVIRLESDPNHPDCNFIEVTAIVVNDVAVISRMGAPERRGEEIPVAEAIKNLKIANIVQLEAPCTMDGGDILYTGRHLFVGLSERTNEYALHKLKEIFQNKVEVIGIPVIHGLHLKSLISLFDTETLVVADSLAGECLKAVINLRTNGSYAFISVPDSVASNVLRVGSTLIAQKGFPASEEILQEACDKKQISLTTLDMSELIKADGALTCGSLLIPKLSSENLKSN